MGAGRPFPGAAYARTADARGLLGAIRRALLDLSRRDDPWGRRRAVVELERLLCELAELRTIAFWLEPAWLGRRKIALGGPCSSTEPGHDGLATGLGLRTADVSTRDSPCCTGLPPHRYLLASRVSHAREMLAHTDLPIKQIARDLGYTDVFYFTRQFRRVTGVPPALFRKTREG